MFLHSELCTSQLWGHLERLKELGILEVCQIDSLICCKCITLIFFSVLQVEVFEETLLWRRVKLVWKSVFCSLDMRKKRLACVYFCPPPLSIYSGEGQKYCAFAKRFLDFAPLGKILKPRLPILSTNFDRETDLM